VCGTPPGVAEYMKAATDMADSLVQGLLSPYLT
jgi:hypothetical protein